MFDLTTKQETARLEDRVLQLALPEGRLVGSEGHDAARDLVVSWMKELDLEPYGDRYELPYRENDETFTNIVGVVPGRDRDAAPVLIGAHYDSVIPKPCADDNVAAIVIALETARELLAEPPTRDVVIAIFDAEEPPYFQTASMGSIRFYEDQMDLRRVHAAVVMDLVGHDVTLPMPGAALLSPILHPLLFLMGSESHPEVAGIVNESLKAVSGLSPVATLNRYVGDVSDHGVFRLHDVPYLFLSCGRWEHYHMPTDTPDRLNYRKMGRIRQYLTLLTRGLVGAALDRAAPENKLQLTGTGVRCDTLELELASLRGALGSLGVRGLAKVLGLSGLKTRHDLDQLARTMGL